jgi:dihydrolipoamide dehydrogenase
MFDLIIIGGGPAGYYAAEKAGSAGFNTFLAEKSHLGGVCLNEGCIPSKTLLYSSKLFSMARHSEQFGITASDVSFDLSKVMTRKRKIIEMMRNGISSTLKKNNVTVEKGEAFILKGNNGSFDVQVNGNTVFGKRLLLCTGSAPVKLPVHGIDQSFVFTNKEILSIDYIPESLVVIGAGAIGLEMAVFFAEAGSKVTVIEMLPRIGGSIDNETGLILKRELEKTGISFLLETRVIEIGEHSVTFSGNGTNGTIGADIVLLSVGRKPVTQGLGIENLGVKITGSAVETDSGGRTSVSGVWAAGDINGKSMLAHTAYREAQVCIDSMLGIESFVNYNAIPGVIYTHPETAGVGLTQSEAEARGIAVLCAKLPMSYNGRYLAENEGGRGMCKVVADKQTQKILGIHLIGAACSEMIYGAAAMIEKNMTVKDICPIVFPHPSVSEIIKDTIMKLPV